MQRPGRGFGLVVLLGGVLALSGLAAPMAAAATSERPALLVPPPLPAGSQPVGALPATQELTFQVVLQPRDPAAVETLLHNLYDPSAPEYEHWLAPGVFAAEYGPSPSTVGATESWLRGLGLHVSASGFTVSATGDVSTVESGLGVSLERYRLHSGRSVFAARAAPVVPDDVASAIGNIVGLDDLPAATPLAGRADKAKVVGGTVSPDAARQPRSTCTSANALAQSNGGYTTTAIGADYGVGTLLADGLTGTGERVGVFELAPSSSLMPTSDVSSFLSCFGLTSPVTVKQIDGGGTVDQGGTEEADLDIEQAASQAPGAAITSYEGPNTDMGAYDTAKQIVSDDTAKFVSDSWGLCEPQNSPSGDGSIAAFDVLMQQAASQGQAIFTAAGDSGSEDCFGSGDNDTSLQVDYPSSSPWVTAVGGTSRSLDGREVVWNQCNGVDNGSACGQGGAGGGGTSRSEPREIWQNGLTEPPTASCGSNGTNCRMVPDVSMNAGVPEAFFTDGGWNLYVGTSLGAPMSAGIWADRAGGCSSTATGDASPVLYLLAAAGAENGGFNDTTSGNNDLTGNNSGDFPAGPGYDLASGLGSMIAGGVACTQVRSVSPSQGPAGTVVTVNGLGLENASFTMNGSPVTPQSTTATTAEIIMPAGSGSVTINATGPVANGPSGGGTFTYGAPSGVFSRVAGNTAIETAIATSQLAYPNNGSAAAVVLARSDFFSDALAGGPLAAAVNGPLLITEGAGQSSSLDPEVLAEIQRVLVSGGTVYILGGDLALSANIDGTLQSLGFKTVRLAGNTEYGTAVLIAQQLNNPSTIFEATGLDFPDALSAVPAAVVTHGAILLTDGAVQDPETASYLAAHPSDTRYAIGGQFAAAGADPGATAIFGQTLFDTSAAVAARFFSSPTAVGAATGANFPDALAAGPGLGRAGAPMLLVPPTGALPASVAAYLGSVAARVNRGTLFGGIFAVSDAVLAELDGAA